MFLTFFSNNDPRPEGSGAVGGNEVTNDETSTNGTNNNEPEQYEKDEECDNDVTNAVMDDGTKQTDDVMSEDEQDKAMIVICRSEILKKKRDDLSNILIYNVVDKKEIHEKKAERSKISQVSCSFCFG